MLYGTLLHPEILGILDTAGHGFARERDIR